ncbi:MAG: ATP-binding cassette domain-containing protein [Oligoflexus sp.]
MLSIHHLQHSYQKKRGDILDIASMKFDQKGVTAILGPNGSGKSTLLSCIAGMIKPRRGSVQYRHMNTWQHFEKIKQDIHLIALEIALFERLSGHEHIQLVKSVAKRWNSTLEEELKEELNIPLDDRIAGLSRGELAKLKILLSICQSPKVILIDEITNDLDTQTRKLIFRKLDAYSYEEGADVFIATNIVFDMERIANHIVLLDAGRVILSEDTDSLKERYKKIRLKAGPVYQGESISYLQHDSLEWNGHTGMLVTSKFDHKIIEILNSQGIETILDPYPLEDIISSLGGQ